MPDELRARVEALEAVVARLEAHEAVIAAFNRYLYSLDTGYADDVLDSYADDAVVDVLNFPPDGIDMHFEGREAMRPLYEPYGERPPTIAGGHNGTNIAVAVSDDASTAELTAYFTTTRPAGIQGGRYEGTLRLEADGRWRFATLAIISAWGWTTDVDVVSEAVPAERSVRGGRSATD